MLLASSSLATFQVIAKDVDMDVVLMIEQNDLVSFKRELEMGLNPNVGLGDLSLLMIAAQIGHLEVVRELIAHKEINLHAQDENGNTALHFAVIFDRLDVVKTLLYADEPENCDCKRHSHPRFLYHIKNHEGKTPADFAYSSSMKEILSNPDEYIQSHPQEFREIAHWFSQSCTPRVEARARRVETFGTKVNRNYQHAKEVVTHATEKTMTAAKCAYEKTKDFTQKGYSATQKAKEKVESKYDKARKFVTRRFDKAKHAAHGAFDVTKEYAHAGYEKTKGVAVSGFEKTKEAFKRAYRRVKGESEL